MDESNHDKKIYLLTSSLGEKVKSFRNAGLKTPDADDPVFGEINAELTRKLGQIFGNEAKVENVDMSDLADEILNKAIERRTILRNGFVVSTCSEIAVPTKGYTIEVNRLVDERGEIIGIGPRPGYPGIDVQIQNIRSMAAEQPLILMEDGSFTGSTLVYLIERLKRERVEVTSIIIGFTFPNAVEKIKEVFGGEVIVIHELADPIDWVPDHDFLPFMPNCGRVFGVSINGKAYPFYTHNGASYSVPYIFPFARSPMMEKWTSIPEDVNNDFSLFCLQQNLRLFQQIDRLNGDSIKIGDLVKNRPKVSIPMSVGQSSFPRLGTSVTDFLSETCHEIC